MRESTISKIFTRYYIYILYKRRKVDGQLYCENRQKRNSLRLAVENSRSNCHNAKMDIEVIRDEHLSFSPNSLVVEWADRWVCQVKAEITQHRTIYFVDYPSRGNTRKITPLMCNDAVCTSLGEAIGSVMNPFRKSLYSSVRSRNGYCFESRLKLREESGSELHAQSSFHIHVCVNFCRPPSKNYLLHSKTVWHTFHLTNIQFKTRKTSPLGKCIGRLSST